MNRLVLGGVIALIFAGVGLFWWQGRARVEQGAPPPLAQPATPSPDALPIVDAGDLRGPAPPEATELTREEQRFFRYDRNRDRRITRNEMLSTRSDAFRKLDIPKAPLLFGLILGHTLEQSFRQALTISNGDALVFVQSPICAFLLFCGLVSIGASLWARRQPATVLDEAKGRVAAESHSG